MHPNRHGKPVRVAAASVANVAVGAGAATVRQWWRCKTSERRTEAPVCLHELATRMRESGSDTDPLTPHGPKAP